MADGLVPPALLKSKEENRTLKSDKVEFYYSLL